jgi:hypothetical protein
MKILQQKSNVMNKILQTGVVAIIILLSLSVNAQSNKCATMQKLEKSFAKNPSLKQRMVMSEQATQDWLAHNSSANRGGGQITTIPVVVHVIWNTSVQNVSDSQIYSQIDVLNEDFRLMNADSLDDQHPFWQFTIDAEIEFCLAQQDPDGNSTTGITRTQTSVTAWDDNNSDDIKSTAFGGHDNWDPTQYLNLYVANLDGTTLGFATFPDELATDPDLDGVVIRYEAFGIEGTAGSGDFADNDGGRTGTHEVGHWLNLKHIWADTLCGDDFVDDTEPAEDANYQCPEFPHRPNNSCGSSADGEMYMNYMDYADDNCMSMFTVGQADRMDAALNGLRSGLLTSQGCEHPSSLNDIAFANSVSVFPNPSNGNFTVAVDLKGETAVSVILVDILGATIKELGTLSKGSSTISVSELSSGAYFLKVSSNSKTAIKKIFVTN